MLALSPLKSSNAEDRDATGGFNVDPLLADDDFLDNIDFSSIFEGFSFDSDNLPELQTPEPHTDVLSESSADGREPETASLEKPEKIEKISRSIPPPPMKTESRRPAAKGSHVKKKVKVDWTPELHRRFVMAVEELGVDKAVPSRILEIMGSLNLTRHNVASHLQKYRSQRKHSLAREAEAGSWNHRRQRYAAVAAAAGSTEAAMNKENGQWISPTIGFPSPSFQPQFRPLHVWGHPTVDRSPLAPAMWQGHGVPLQPRPPPWPQPPHYFAYWRPHFHSGSGEGWGPNAVLPPPHFIHQPLLGVRFAPPPVAGVPSQQMYSPQHWAPPLNHPFEQNAHPSKESIDAAIGDVLAKPWLPLPLGLKPPSTESVMGELQRQGVPKVPPGCNPQ